MSGFKNQVWFDRIKYAAANIWAHTQITGTMRGTNSEQLFLGDLVLVAHGLKHPNCATVLNFNLRTARPQATRTLQLQCAGSATTNELLAGHTGVAVTGTVAVLGAGEIKGAVKIGKK